MRKLVTICNRMLDGMAKVGLALANFAILGLAFAIVAGVISRYIFSTSLIWLEDFAGATMIPIYFLPLLYVLLVDKHIKIKLLIDHLPFKVRTCLLLASSLVAVMYLGFVVHEGVGLVRGMILHHAMYLTLPIPQAVSAIFIPVGAGMFCLGCIALFVSQIRGSLKSR